MKKIIELLRRFTTAIGITGYGVHTFYSLLFGIVCFYAGIWLQDGHGVWAGFLAAFVIPPMIGLVFEIGQDTFEPGEGDWRDVLSNLYGATIAAALLTSLNLIFL